MSTFQIFMTFFLLIICVPPLAYLTVKFAVVAFYRGREFFERNKKR